MGLIRLFKHDLAMETRTWVKKKIITQDQAVELCQTYGVDFHNITQKSKGYWVLVILGYLFLGLALMTLIGANWDSIPREVRMAGLIGLTLSTHLMGLFKIRRGRQRAGIGFFFLGSLFYGVSIMLIGQIYHIGEHFPNGNLLWALGVLPLALMLKSLTLMFLASGLGMIWFFLESYLGYFPWLFPLFLAAMAWHLFRASPSRILFLLIIILSGLFCEYGISWSLGGWQRFDFHLENLFFIGAWVILCQGLAIFLETRSRSDLKDYGTLLSLWCLRFFLVTLFIFSFEASWEEMITSAWQVPGFAMAAGSLISFGSVGLAFLGHRQIKDLIVPGLIALIYMAYMLGMIMVDEPATALYFAVIDNIILIVTGTWLIISGIRRAVSHYFFLGVLTILLLGLIRYMDLVGDYLGAAAMFLGFALILLVTARFWRSRHNVNHGRQTKEIT